MLYESPRCLSIQSSWQSRLTITTLFTITERYRSWHLPRQLLNMRNPNSSWLMKCFFLKMKMHTHKYMCMHAYTHTHSHTFLISRPFPRKFTQSAHHTSLLQNQHWSPSPPTPHAITTTLPPQSHSPLEHLGNSGSHLFRAWHCTLVGPFMTKPGWQRNSTMSCKENKPLLADTMIASSTTGGVHLLGMMHCGGGPLQMPTWPSLLVQ
jgi:hypothetical protein